MMNMAMVETEVDDPPDPDVVEVDPSGRYLRYNEFLGEGAFKKVYKAFDLVEGIEVAWNQIHMDKVLKSAQDYQRLSTELHLLKTLKHKNIIKFYKSWVDEEKKTANIITELFTSGNLRDYRKKHKNIDIKAVKRWARQILTGLDYLHSHDPPIIHRDLKCSNILINGNHGEVKIADLGFATVMDRPDLQKGIGTPKFMAPELFDEDYSELVDIYSFGMCMLEMATSEYPYGECTRSAQVYKKVASGLMSVSLSNVKDPNLKQFIEKCLVPASRRLSAKELLRDSFLQVDCTAAAISSSLPPAISSKLGVLGNSYLTSEEPSTMQPDFQIELLAVEDGEHVVVISTEYDVSMSHTHVVKICIAKGSSKYMLKAKLRDEKHASLKLPIGKQRGKLKNIKFGFDLGNDTSLSLANEMVGEFNLSGGSVLFIAELIDLSLIKLVPNWTPTVSIDHIVDLTGVSMCEERDEEEEDGESVVSFNNLFEDVPLTDTIPSTQELLPQLGEALDYMGMNQVEMVSVDIDSHCSAMKEDRSSTTSMMCTDENYNKCSINPCMSSEYVNDPELKAELENIELEFQRDMQEITMKRHKAIMAAQARWSQRNIE